MGSFQWLTYSRRQATHGPANAGRGKFAPLRHSAYRHSPHDDYESAVRFGDACRQFMDEEMRGLTLDHVEVDEIWTFVAKKQARLHVDERDNPELGDMYMWVALDQETKLVPTFIIGKRSADMARRLMVDLPAASTCRVRKIGGTLLSRRWCKSDRWFQGAIRKRLTWRSDPTANLGRSSKIFATPIVRPETTRPRR